MSASLVAKEKEVGKIKRENPEYTLPVSNSKAEDDICYISPGNLFFDVVLSKKLVTQLYVPKSISSELPFKRVPAVLRHGARDWKVTYIGNAPMPRFDPREWEKFVTQNRLKLGDACVFELMENAGTNLRFKVHIFRVDDLPLELFVGPGMTLEAPICID